MRFELAGSLIQPEPLVIRIDTNQTFDTLKYIDLGYTHFEIICIGGGGGRGGGIDTVNSGTLVRNFGGAGGGGGFHRVRGLLSALPDACNVIVGQGGAPGNDHVSNPALTTNGGDGGTSSFNTNTGGAAGGIAGTPTATGPGTPGSAGADGTFINNVGKGGGGGAGGVGKYGGVMCCPATAGGRGAYNPGNTSVYGPGQPPSNDPSTGAVYTKPGGASGAKASPLNGLPTIFGQSFDGVGDPGVVIIRLTVE